MKQIYPPNANIKDAFKWMFNPKTKTIIVCAWNQYHAEAHRMWSENRDFYEWIRVIHLSPNDFKFKKRNDLICVRRHLIDYSREDVKKFIRSVGITGRIIHDVDNNKLCDLTRDYMRRW